MAQSVWTTRVRVSLASKAAAAAEGWARDVAQARGDKSVYARASGAAAAALRRRVAKRTSECFRLGNEAWNRRDYLGAEGWFLLAAEQGHDEAMCNIGALCAIGHGIPGKEDFAAAVRWYTYSANAGNDVAAKNLGMLLLIGKPGAPQNRAEGLRWVRFAAERGNKDAKAFLYDVERNTRGTGQGSGGGANGAGGQQNQSRGRKMTRAEALEIFDLKEGATRDQIKAAYARLMRHVHPDVGGSNHFAKELNEARDLLLG
jgi:TPR repeat protein